MKKCTSCGAKSYRKESSYCLMCGAALPQQQNADKLERRNICTNPDCDWNKTRFIYPDDARFCDMCGSATIFND